MADVVRYINVDVVGGAGDGTSWPNAYSSMSAWNAAEATNLVTDGDTHTVYCRASADSPDTTKVELSGWVTGSGNELSIIVLPEDRHDGTADTGYRIVVDGAYSPCLDVRVDYISLIGIAAKNTSAQNVAGIEIKSVDVGERILDSCLVYESCANGIHINDSSATAYISNCIVQSCGQGAYGGDGVVIECNSYIYNCISVNNAAGTANDGHGFYCDGFITANATNCYAGGNDDDAYSVNNATLNTTTCHADDETGDTQTAFSTSSGAYFTNVTSGSEDMHIKADSDLIDVGTDLHSDPNYPFDYDAWDTSRPNGEWDVGAHEYEAVGPGPGGQPGNNAGMFSRPF